MKFVLPGNPLDRGDERAIVRCRCRAKSGLREKSTSGALSCSRFQICVV